MITIEQLQEKLGGNLWIKGEMKRIYLDRGYNTKKMTTKTYVYEKSDGNFGVSCYIDCPSQDFNWIKSQQQQVIEGVESDIEDALSDTIFIMTNNESVPVKYNGESVALNYAENFLNEKNAIKELDNCSSYQKYITMPRDEFEKEVERLDAIDREERSKILSTQPIPQNNEASSTTHSEELATYKVGDRVKHGKFGEGEIMADNGKIIEVKFSEGVKQLMKKFTILKLVDNATN